MKRKHVAFFFLLIAVLLFGSTAPLFTVSATEQTEETQEEGAESETETEIVEAYNWPIETNELTGWPQGPQVEAEAAVVMDLDTGAFLYSKNMEAKMYPASITKIMTVLVALDHLDESELDEKIEMTDTALASITADSSQIYLTPGEKITMRSALYAIMLASANDAASLVAEVIGGSIDQFVEMMNEKAEEIGCVNTHFTNPHGLHDDDHYTCAYDMALITQAACENPLFLEITGTVNYKIPRTKYMKEPRWLVNHHKMLNEDDEFYYSACIGGKTGFTDNAWNTLVTIAEQDGMRLVCVELRVNGADKTFRESTQLLDYAFENFRQEPIDVRIDNRTLGQLAGNCRLGIAAAVDAPEARDEAVIVEDSITVTMPNKLKKKKLNTTIKKDGDRICCEYQGWTLGSGTIRFRTPIFEIRTPTVSEATAQWQQRRAETETESERETETEILGKRPEEKAEEYMNQLTSGIFNVWEKFEAWIDANELLAAVIGFLLIVLLIPLLIIAFIRDRKVRSIDKERKKEKETRRQMEESIEKKSVREIEEEIRAELEKEEQAQERAKRREREAREEEERIAEMEAVIERQENRAKSGQKTTEVEDELGSTD